MTKPPATSTRRTGGLKPPIRAAHHLAQRQRERDCWSPTRPLQDHERKQHESSRPTRWTTTDRILIGAAVVFLLAAIAIKTLPPL